MSDYVPDGETIKAHTSAIYREHWEHQRETIRRDNERRAGRDAATRLVTDFKVNVCAILLAAELGETGLVTTELITSIHSEMDRLEAAACKPS